ncbi:related to integral membrane protein pth11 [Phialocephala subalpina]|uniref:Related to integral membrane protein pth11 n=1 Tax=Phialocephala subalpina TaxID=576137 RepID=A0A1L7XNG5_9HELO|nr:related to integral membrane protein pth11 [Phialocephala subalpina]
MMVFPRDDDVVYISPEKEVNAGLWTLFVGSTLFLGARVWCKYMRRTGLWYDDYTLIASWLMLLFTDIVISVEYALGYDTGNWDDRMHILINISSCGTLIGQAWSKTALGITLLRMSNKKQAAILWFCIITMNSYMIVKVFFQWAKYCGKDDYQSWYRFQGPCINYNFEQNFKVGGNTYNIIMDFIFACFPWWITWNLEMRRVEKVALCATMSLGLLVAIISAVRTTWKDRPIMHQHDEYYMWRNGMSNIWYSAEVAGTIIVQCIPILRPFLRDMHTTLTSKKLDDTENGQSATWRSRRSTLDGKQAPVFVGGDDKKHAEIIAMDAIPEDPHEIGKETASTRSIEIDTGYSTPTIPAGPLFGDMWQFSGSEHTDIHQNARSASNTPATPMFGDTWRLSGSEREEIYSPESATWVDLDQHGLSPPPPRTVRNEVVGQAR